MIPCACSLSSGAVQGCGPLRAARLIALGRVPARVRSMRLGRVARVRLPAAASGVWPFVRHSDGKVRAGRDRT